jgi:hypothetical protein
MSPSTAGTPAAAAAAAARARAAATGSEPPARRPRARPKATARSKAPPPRRQRRAPRAATRTRPRRGVRTPSLVETPSDPPSVAAPPVADGDAAEVPPVAPAASAHAAAPFFTPAVPQPIMAASQTDPPPAPESAPAEHRPWRLGMLRRHSWARVHIAELRAAISKRLPDRQRLRRRLAAAAAVAVAGVTLLGLLLGPPHPTQPPGAEGSAASRASQTALGQRAITPGGKSPVRASTGARRDRGRSRDPLEAIRRESTEARAARRVPGRGPMRPRATEPVRAAAPAPPVRSAAPSASYAPTEGRVAPNDWSTELAP